MTVYKYFIKTALKNKVIISIYIGLFLMTSLLLVSTVSEQETGFRASSLNIGVIDNNNSQLSTALVEYLGERNSLVDIINDEEDIKELIFLEVLDAVIVINEDFDRRVMNKEEALLFYNDVRKVQSIQLQSQINKFLNFANASYENGSFNLELVRRALSERIEVKLVRSEDKVVNNVISQWFATYFKFVAYFIIGIYIAVIGLVMADFKESKIRNRVKISSKKPFN